MTKCSTFLFNHVVVENRKSTTTLLHQHSPFVFSTMPKARHPRWRPPTTDRMFHTLVFAGEIDRVSECLRSGADLNEEAGKSSFGDPPLFLALRGPRGCELSYLRWLVSEGADPQLVNEHGETALHVFVGSCKTLAAGPGEWGGSVELQAHSNRSFLFPLLTPPTFC